jgi:PAS domain S-box-containing protein
MAQAILRRTVDLPGEHVPFRFRARHKEGMWRWVDGVCTNHLNNPVVQAFVVNYRDVTESRLAEAALQQSEERYRTLVENELHGVVVHRDDLIYYANPALAKMFGYTAPDELLGRNLFDTLVAPEDRQIMRERRDAVLRGEPLRPLPCWRGIRRDGQSIWSSTMSSKMKWQDRDAVVSFFADITERKRAEEALRASEAKYRAILDNAVEGFFQATPQGQFLSVNPAMVRILGYDCPDELLIGIKDIGAQLYLDPARRLEYMRRIESDGIVSGFEIQIRRKDGSSAWISEIARAVRDAAGTLLYYEGTIIDITQRKLAEEALRDSEARNRAILQALPDLIFVNDKNGVYLDYHAQDPARWLSSSSPFLGKKLGEVLPSRIADLLHSGQQHVLQTGSTWLGEYSTLQADGSHWCEARIVPCGADRTLTIIQDITQRKRGEDQRRQLESQIRHAQKLESLGVLAGGIAHDFNNLLTSVLGYTTLARNHLPADSPAGPMLEEIDLAAQRAADLTRQMLAYSGRGTFVIKPLRLDTLIHEIINLLGTVVSKKATINLSLQPAVIEGDATQIRQVVMNVITNASDALEGKCGRIDVRTGVREETEKTLRSPFLPESLPPGDYAYLEVEDTGCGMTQDTLIRIFDPFFTTKFTGRGLGLAAVLGIVKGHKGTIKVESSVGKGTLFQLLLPSSAEKAVSGRALECQETPLRGHGTILLVEDESSVRSYTRTVLQEAGFQVLEAGEGGEGLAHFAEHRDEIDAVLLDLTMPRMDGMEVLAELRRLKADVPVLVMSGYGEPEVTVRCAGMGLSGFIQKPFRPRDLVARVCLSLSTARTMRDETKKDQAEWNVAVESSKQ